MIRRACFNLPKLLSITTAQSLSSINPANPPVSPISQHYSPIDTTLSAPITNRKTNLHDYLVFSTSQSKEAPSRGISPCVNRNTPTNNVYNPSSIERL